MICMDMLSISRCHFLSHCPEFFLHFIDPWTIQHFRSGSFHMTTYKYRRFLFKCGLEKKVLCCCFLNFWNKKERKKEEEKDKVLLFYCINFPLRYYNKNATNASHSERDEDISQWSLILFYSHMHSTISYFKCVCCHLLIKNATLSVAVIK